MDKLLISTSLTLEAAQFLAQAAIDHARQTGFKMNAVVVDAAGNALISLRDPGAPLPARDFAEKKAYTAACYGWSTDKWNDILADRAVITAGLAQHEKIAMFGGGLPIVVEGEVVGAIGVAGGKVADDIACAEAAINAFNRL